jgi:peptidoglycan/xylan/chitin deacetylase (PgdA/CDA1 family)
VSSTPATSVAFESTHEFAFFDYFRVPYVVRREGFEAGSPEGPLGVLRPLTSTGGSPRQLVWWRGGPKECATIRAGRFQLAGFSIAAHVACVDPDEQLPRLGHEWRPLDAIVDQSGDDVAAVWESADGTVFLPFDPGEAMLNLWSERYSTLGRRGVGRAARSAMLRTYYLVRPVLPRRLQIVLRRTFAAQQGVPDFPTWPLETSLHDLYDWLFDLTRSIAGVSVPWIDVWPAGKTWAFVLTHDVETATGVATRELLRDAERRHGLRSSWNFVPERYDVGPDVIAELEAAGCEIGVHGLRHDGRDLASARLLSKRLPAIRAAADRWRAVGFRSPATQRYWELMPRLGFDYDSSYTDTDPYEPQPGGCCTYWPFGNADLVELPITLPQDHTLFRVLRDVEPDLWRRKARELRRRGGMVLVLAHPDYADDPAMVEAWEALLAELAGDPTMWQALPREVATWWRDRAASELVRAAGTWTIKGPAAKVGQVRFGAPSAAYDGVRV